MAVDTTVQQTQDLRLCLAALERRVAGLPAEHQALLAEPLANVRAAAAAPQGSARAVAVGMRPARDRLADDTMALLDTLLSHAPVGLAFLDRDLRYVRVNDFFATIDGIAPAAHLGRTPRELCSGLAHAEEPLMRRVLETGKPILNLERSDGIAAAGQRNFLTNYYPVRAKDGSVRGVGVAIADITRHKQVEEALLASKERFRHLVEANIVGIIMANTELIIDANDAFLNLVGYTREDLIAGKLRWRKMTPPEYRDLDDRALEELHATGKCKPFEKEYIRADGSRVPILIGAALLDPDPLTWVCFVLDLTERKRVEEEHARRMAQFRALADASLLINSALSLDAVLRAITEQARAIIGAHLAVTSLAVDENWAQGVSVFSLSDKYAAWRGYKVHPDGSGIYAMVCRTNRPMRLTQEEMTAHPAWRNFGAAAGWHPPLRGWLAAPLIGRDGRNMGVVQLSDKQDGEFTEADETILVQLAHLASVAIENARLYDEAQQAIRVRDDFLSIASHELKTPLTSLLGNAQLLQRRTRHEGVLEERDRRSVAVIAEQALRLNQMIAALLDISRLQAGQLSITRAPVELCTLLCRLAEEVQPALDQHMLHLTCTGEPLVVIGDELRLEQVIQNLLQNAVKYSPQGGSIAVRVERHDRRASVAVSDQGIGIPSAALPQLFQRFYRAANAEARYISGMGVGLYVVKEIVTLHGGTVEVSSVEGVGSTFTIWLPLAASPISDS